MGGNNIVECGFLFKHKQTLIISLPVLFGLACVIVAILARIVIVDVVVVVTAYAT